MRYLKYFTFLNREEIESLGKQHAEKPESRVAHRALAKAVTDLVHGETATGEAMRASEILFGGGVEGVSESTFADIVGEAPSKDIEKSKFDGAGLGLLDALVQAGLSSSRGQARKDIEGGGIYTNNVREPNLQRSITSQDLLFGQFPLLRKGKRNYALLTAR